MAGFIQRLATVLRTDAVPVIPWWRVLPGTRPRAEPAYAGASLRETFDLVPVALIQIGKQDRIVYANPEAATLFGCRREDLIAKPVASLLPEFRESDTPTCPQSARQSVDSSSTSTSQTLVARKMDGGELLVKVTTSKRRFDGAPALLAAIVNYDYINELRRDFQELAHVTRVLALGELSGSLAHELNQPLTAILHNAQAAQRFLDAERIDLNELREALNDIVKDDCRAGEIIRRIRALVKKSDMEIQTLDVGSIVRDVAMIVRSDATRRGVQMTLAVDGHLPRVRGDKVQLQQVVLNLLLNSFDAMTDCSPADRVVSVSVCAHSGDHVCIAVSDRGHGLTAEQHDRIFRPFFTSKPQGLGLGLSISRSIVAAHGGLLWAENNVDRGTTFYVTLPSEVLVAPHRPDR